MHQEQRIFELLCVSENFFAELLVSLAHVVGNELVIEHSIDALFHLMHVVGEGSRVYLVVDLQVGPNQGKQVKEKPSQKTYLAKTGKFK